jgi:hypothetical protein
MVAGSPGRGCNAIDSGQAASRRADGRFEAIVPVPASRWKIEVRLSPGGAPQVVTPTFTF